MGKCHSDGSHDKQSIKTSDFRHGTRGDDYFLIDVGGASSGLRGDDHFTLDTGRSVVVDGGFGHDTFEFQAFIGQSVVFNEIDSEKTVIKIFDDVTGDRLQKMALLDVEQIDWFMNG